MHKAMIIILIGSVPLMTACDVDNHARAATTVQSTSMTTAPASRRCGFHFDGTPSVNEAARRETVKRIGESLPKVVDDQQCTSVSVSVFTNKGWFTPVEHFQIPREHHEPCAAATPTPARRVLQPFEGFRQVTNQQCRDQFEREKKQALDARKPVFAEITTALSKIGTVEAPCTDLFMHVALINRIRGEHDIDWVITDSAQSCDDEITMPVSNIVFIVVPSNGNPGEVAAKGITNATDVAKRFPGSLYLLPAQVSADGWWKGSAR